MDSGSKDAAKGNAAYRNAGKRNDTGASVCLGGGFLVPTTDPTLKEQPPI